MAGGRRGQREKEKQENPRECSADQGGRAPFEGGLLNFQGHSRGPVARRREKARGRRAKERGERKKGPGDGTPGRGEGREGGRGPDGDPTRKFTPKSKSTNARARFLPIDGPIGASLPGP